MIERSTLFLDTKKPVRSFVERQGRITPQNKELAENLWPRYGIPLTNNKLDYEQVFGRVAPIVVEIGFGNGLALLELAKQHPEHDFIGIEVYKAGIAKLLAGINSHNLTNIRVFCADALEVFTNCLEDASLHKVLVFFPDPWPKLRHHKRRLVQTNFVKLIASKLQIDGILHMATDWEDYAMQMLAVMEAEQNWDNLAGSGRFVARPDTRALTKFEQRGKRLGYDIWDLMFRKNS